MRRDFQPSPMAVAMPLLRWLFFLMLIGGLGRWWFLFWPSLILFIFHAAFHRNPRRKAPEDTSIFVAPADGVVTDIAEVEEPKFVQGKTWRISIFLSVFDVHTQPAPCDGTLKYIGYQPGKFLDARHPDCSPQNEAQFLGLETKDGIRVGVKQIAGAIARRIVLWRLPHEEVRRGELLGMIRYGSRVELFVPSQKFEVQVQVGTRVRGGATPLVRRK
jgi:phosphatidylserine decarboxylase